MERRGLEHAQDEEIERAGEEIGLGRARHWCRMATLTPIGVGCQQQAGAGSYLSIMLSGKYNGRHEIA
jgi:hypothetical protein